MAPGATADVNDLLVGHNADGTHKAAAARMTGEMVAWPMKTAPSGWLLCDGTAVSRTTYAALFGVLCPTLGNPTVSIATPCVVTLNNHGLAVGDSFYFTTTGALPTGVAANTLYYVVAAGYGANGFEFSATRGGSAVNSSGTQSGVHGLIYCPYGLGNGSTTFNTPDFLGRAVYGLGTNGDLTIGNTDGLTVASRTPSHAHSAPLHGHPQNVGATVGYTADTSKPIVTPSSTGTGQDLTNITGTGGTTYKVQNGVGNNTAANTSSAGPAFPVANWIIKT
jgi:microcystin-dependent protein